MSDLSRQAANRLVRLTDGSQEHPGQLYGFYSELSADGKEAFTTLAGIVSDIENIRSLEIISRSTKDHSYIADLVGSVNRNAEMTDDQVEKAKTWAIRMAAQQMAENKHVPKDSSTLPSDFDWKFVEDED